MLTVAALGQRDWGRRCWHCHETEGVGVQHRGAKGMGGSNEAERPSNGIVLCNLFNGAVEADPDAASLAAAYGYKISRWVDPSSVPVYDALTGTWWRLDDDMGRRQVA